jgi:predicted transcriptional regulator
MEDVGLVSFLMGDSPRGPKRKEYLLNKSISVTIDFAPNLFRTKVMTFDSLPDVEDLSHSAYQLISKINEVLKHPEDMGYLNPLSALVSKIDQRLSDLEDERSVLLYIRHLAMGEIVKAISGIEMPTNMKKMLIHIMNEHEKVMQEKTKSLNLKDELVQETLMKLNRELLA